MYPRVETDFMTGQLITFPVRLYVRGARLLIHAAEDVTGKAVMGTLRVAGALGNLRGSANGSSAAATPPPPPFPPSSSLAERRPSPVTPESATPPGAESREAAPRPATPRAAAPRSRPARPQPTPASTPADQYPDPDPRIAPRGQRDVAPAQPTPPRAEATDGAGPEPLAGDRLEQEGVAVPIDLDAPAPAVPDHVSAEPVLVREEAEAGAEDGAGAAITVQEPWKGYGQLNARDVVARLTAASTAELAAVQLYEGTHRKRQSVTAAVQRELAKPQR
jgi:hypothetical protein